MSMCNIHYHMQPQNMLSIEIQVLFMVSEKLIMTLVCHSPVKSRRQAIFQFDSIVVQVLNFIPVKSTHISFIFPGIHPRKTITSGS